MFIKGSDGIKSARAENSRICSLLICSFTHFAQIKGATVSNLLRSLKTKELLWANRSGHSWQMSDREQITQGAHDRRATMSDSLRALMIKRRMSKSVVFFEREVLICSFAHKKRAICSKTWINPNPHGMFWTKVIYDHASSEPYSLSSLNRKNLKNYVIVQKDLGNPL